MHVADIDPEDTSYVVTEVDSDDDYNQSDTSRINADSTAEPEPNISRKHIVYQSSLTLLLKMVSLKVLFITSNNPRKQAYYLRINCQFLEDWIDFTYFEVVPTQT